MTDPNCVECGGEGIVNEQDRTSSDGIREEPCPVCNIFDEDAAYESFKDSEIDLEEAKKESWD